MIILELLLMGSAEDLHGEWWYQSVISELSGIKEQREKKQSF